jgi:peptidoglycan/LPS O-acetylase OafA/YrhL
LGYLSAAAPGYKGPPFHVTIPQILLHLGYLNVFFGLPWINGVFWTLAIEFQYYLLMGLAFFFIVSPNLFVRLGLFVFFGILAFAFPVDTFLPHWLFVFMLGMLTFQRYANLPGVRGPCFFVLAVLLSIGAAFTCTPLIALVGLATAMTIAFVKINNRFLTFFGTISYSLYLIHEPLGRRFCNILTRFLNSDPARLLVLLLGLAFVIGAAYLLWRFVEAPAQQWASRISYKTKKETSLVATNLPSAPIS